MQFHKHALCPLIFIFISVILSFITVLAGSSKNSLEDYDVATLNTSQIAKNILGNTTLFNLNETNPLYKFVSLAAPNPNQTTKAPPPTSADTQQAAYIDQILQQLSNSKNPAFGLVQNLTVSFSDDLSENFRLFVKNTTSELVRDLISGYNLFLQNVTGSPSLGAQSPLSLPAPQPANPLLPQQSSNPLISLLQGNNPLAPPPPANPLDAISSAVSQLSGPLQATPIPSAAASPLQQYAQNLTSEMLRNFTAFLGNNMGDYFSSQVTNETTAAVQLFLQDFAQAMSTQLNALIADNSSEPLAQFLGNAPPDFSNKMRDFANDALNGIMGFGTSSLGIQGWYSAHLTQFCYGTYLDPPSVGLKSRKNVLGCMKLRDVSDVDLSIGLQKNFDQAGIAIQVPRNITPPGDFVNAVKITRSFMNTLLAFYVVALLFGVFALAATTMAVFKDTAIVDLANVFFALVFGFFLTLASASANLAVTIMQIIYAIFGGWISVTVNNGTKFSSMSWAAAVLADIAFFAWLVLLIMRMKWRKSVVYDEHGNRVVTKEEIRVFREAANEEETQLNQTNRRTLSLANSPPSITPPERAPSAEMQMRGGSENVAYPRASYSNGRESPRAAV